MTESNDAIAVLSETSIQRASDVERFRSEIKNFFENHLRLGKNGKGDYGKIDGCGDVNVLFKSGAEKFLAWAELRWNYECMTERIEPSTGEYYYRYRCSALNKTGEVIGVSEAVCTTLESKYYYVRLRDVTTIKDKEKLLEAGELVRHVNSSGKVTYLLAEKKIHDKAHTACRIAQKRALVGAAFAALRILSEFLTMDLEDMIFDYVVSSEEGQSDNSEKSERPEKEEPSVDKPKSEKKEKAPKIKEAPEMKPTNIELSESEQRESAIHNYNVIGKYIEEFGYNDESIKDVKPKRLVGIEIEDWPTDGFKEAKQKLVLFFRGRAYDELKKRDGGFSMERIEFNSMKIKDIAALLRTARKEFPL